MGGGADRPGWAERIGFGAGDLAQNLAFSAVSTYLLFFLTDVAGVPPLAASAMFLAVHLVDALWTPFAGLLVDRLSPPWGKYRSYLVLAGLPLAAFAALCFTCPFGGALKAAYAAAAYAGFALLFTLVNVSYGALGASLTRDTGEITALTAVRIFMANAGSLAAMAGVPALVAALAGGETPRPWRLSAFMALGMLPSFAFMPLMPALRRMLGKKRLFYVFSGVAVAGMAALYALSRCGRVGDSLGLVYAAQFVKATGIIVATGHMWALVPEVIAYSERMTGRRVSGIVNGVMGVFFRVGIAGGKIVSGLVLAWTGYRAAAVAEGEVSLPAEPRAWLWAMLALALVTGALFVFSFRRTKERVVMDAAASAQVGAGELWREFRRNGPLRCLALFFVVTFAMMSVGNAAGAYFMNGLEAQAPLAQEGVRWLVCVLPAILAVVAAAALARYPLSDEAVDRINREIVG